MSALRRRLAGWCAPLVLAACAGGPPVPEWRMNASASLERALAAYLSGESRVETQEFQLARSEVGRTGRLDLLARIELARCAVLVASTVAEECPEFEKLRADAAAPERAYADFLGGRLRTQDADQLPVQYRAVARASGASDAGAALKGIDDPLSRLIAAGVLLRAGRADPAVLALAVETASEQGWRRALLAWLGIQALRAEQGGDAEAAARLRRRIDIVGGSATKAP
jgi:hypothetical protein